MKYSRTTKGFTIVELLIVIVVIGILAAITIVAFNGVQDRAHNAKIETAVANYRKAMIMYATEHGSYPVNASACLGEAEHYPSGCWNASVNSTFNTAIRPYTGGSLPEIYNGCFTMYGSCRRGAHFMYNTGTSGTLDGSPHYWFMPYMLKGQAKRCTVTGQTGGTWTAPASTPNSSGYIETTDGTTLCRLFLPNPASL